MPSGQLLVSGAFGYYTTVLRALVRSITVATLTSTVITATCLAGSPSAAGIVDPMTTGGICVGSLIECAPKQRVLVVNFDLGSAALNLVARRKLDELSSELTSPQLQACQVKVDGHTDAVGTETNNLVLSVDRANTVAHYLAMRGVAPTRISKAGKGESNPISSPTNPFNRRVNIKCQP